MFPLLCILFFCLVFLLFTYLEIKRYRWNKQFKHIPGPRQFPIIGNVFAIKRKDITDPKALSDELVTSPVVRITWFNKMMFLVSDPQLLEQILGSNAFSDRVPFLTNFWNWNESLIMVRYPIWRNLRKAVRTAFNHTQLNVLFPIMVKHVEKYETMINQYADTGVSFDFINVAVEVAMSLGLESLVNCTSKDPKLKHHHFELIMDSFANRCLRPYLYSDWIYKLTKNYKNVLKSVDTLEKIFKSIVDDAVVDFENQNGNGNTLIELLLAARSEGKITTKQLMDTALFTFDNNYESTAPTTSFAILMLAMHPEVDKKLLEELKQHYKKGDPLSNELLRKLTYMEMVIKETLRLFPIPMTNRCNTKEVYIDGIGNLPKGTFVIPVFYKLHRWKHIWGPDAEEFNPDHFLPENVAKRHPFSFLGFSAGPRMCLGHQYAMSSLKLALIHILTNFRFETDLKYEDLRLKFTVALQSINGYSVRAYRR